MVRYKSNKKQLRIKCPQQQLSCYEQITALIMAALAKTMYKCLVAVNRFI